MPDLQLDTDGDLDLSTGDVRQTSGLAALAQRLRVALETQLGELEVDTSYGVPWRQEVLVKSPDLQAVRSLVRAVVVEVPGVAAVERLTLQTDRATRALAFDFRVIGADTAGQRTPLTARATLDRDGTLTLVLDGPTSVL